ncbi:MAG: hypothetical protein MUE50_10240 [Pirellulaceae bacterium]|nr:hypothetical protein [Pirellulaceae bacterium]
MIQPMGNRQDADRAQQHHDRQGRQRGGQERITQRVVGLEPHNTLTS